MSDIVERLRDPSTAGWPIRKEAADEIERLKADLAAYANSTVDKRAAEAEIERLRARIKDLEEQCLVALGERRTALEGKP